MAARKIALVTGSSSGIGEGIARRLALDGFHVIVHSGRSVEAGTRLAEELEGTYLQADLGDSEHAAAAVSDLLDGMGQLDVLVNNAGVSWPIPHTDMRQADPHVWRRILEVNLIAPWALSTVALPHLVRSRGCIVNITSHAGVRPKGSSIPYAASKAALNHVTRLMASAFGPDVRVNAVAPGLVDTVLTESWAEVQETWRVKSPMRRAATPIDVADAVAWLTSSAYVTGEVVVLDGGLNLT